MLLLLLRTNADRSLLVVPAERLMFVREVAMVAVMVLALRPKDTPPPLAKVKADARFEVVPAEKLMEPCVEATVAVAVRVDPFNPKLTLLELLKTNWSEMLFDVVPPEKLRACCAVTTLPFSPKLTLLLFEKVRAERLLLVVPALTLMLVRDVAIEPVTVWPLTPKLTPLLLLKTTVPKEAVAVPALI
jgi:hypothetical protein